VRERFHVSERRACRALEQARSTQRYCSRVRDDEERLTGRIVALARYVRALWVSPGVGTLTNGELVGAPQESRAHLASRGSQGAPEAAQTGAVLAE
jgi:hypothetical protein